MKRVLLTLLCLLSGPHLWSEVTFGSLDISAGNQLVFQATVDSPVTGTFRSHFLANPAASTLETLTFYPERLFWLGRTNQLQVQNRFGVFRTNPAGTEVSIVSPEAFVTKTPVAEGKVLPTLSSPDGRYLLYFKTTSIVEGSLQLYDISKDETYTVTTNLMLNFSQVPALWSPDSQFFVYEKDARLYYFSLKQKDEKRVPAENLRNLGDGLLGSINWSPAGELLYMWDNILYRILPEEFFTRSLYAGIFRVGGILGKIPFNFQPEKDRYWLSPDRSQLLLNLGGRLLFLYSLNYQDFYQGEALIPLSYIPLPENQLIRTVLWDASGNITLLASSLTSGKDYSQLLRIKGNETKVLIAPQEDLVREILLSPNGKTCVVVQDKGLTLYDYESFKTTGSVPNPGTLSAVFKDDQNLILASRSQVQLYNLASKTGKLLLLGEVDQVGFTDTGVLAARKDKAFYAYAGKGVWQAVVQPLTFVPAKTASADYRAYTEDLPPGSYKNIIQIRDLKALQNRTLFPRPIRDYDAFPASDETVNPDVFAHGSRVRARQISLSINCEDSSEGLTQLLRALRDYGFKATFFINGEFLRRNNGASRELAGSGQETASMFYINFNMADSRFTLDNDFIKRGLARQEDDWFSVTGKELGLLWHTPGYFQNKVILDAAKSMNYQFVGTDVSYPLGASRSVNTTELILDLLKNKKPGSIIPLTLGMKDSKTGESFFSRIDLLFNALMNLGFESVTVSTLREAARK